MANDRRPASDDWQQVDDWQEDGSAATPGRLEALLRGGGQGVTFGFGDELAGLLGSMAFKKYDQVRDSERAKNSAAEKAHPGTYLGGNIAGSVATSMIPGVGVARGAGLVKSLANAAKIGAAMGYGGSDAKDFKGQAIDTAIGTAGGLIGEGAGRLIGGGAKALSRSRAFKGAQDKLKDFAERRAVKQAGAMLSDERGLRHQGRLNKMGRLLLDENVVTPLASTAKVAKRLDPMVDTTGQALGKSEEKFDELLAQAPSHVLEQGFNPGQTGQRIDKEVLQPLRESPALADIAATVDPKVARLIGLGDKTTSFAKGGKIKRDFDKLVSYEQQQSPTKETIKKVRGSINDDLESAAQRVSSYGGHSDEFGAWKNNKERYGLLVGAKEMADDMVARKDANRWLSPSDYASLIGGGILGSQGNDRNGGSNSILGGGLLGVGANRFGRTYGNAIAARLADRLAKAVAKQGTAAIGNSAVYPALGVTGAKQFMGQQAPKDDFAPTDRQPQSMSAADDIALIEKERMARENQDRGVSHPEIAGGGGLIGAMDKAHSTFEEMRKPDESVPIDDLKGLSDKQELTPNDKEWDKSKWDDLRPGDPGAAGRFFGIETNKSDVGTFYDVINDDPTADNLDEGHKEALADWLYKAHTDLRDLVGDGDLDESEIPKDPSQYMDWLDAQGRINEVPGFIVDWVNAQPGSKPKDENDYKPADEKEWSQIEKDLQDNPELLDKVRSKYGRQPQSLDLDSGPMGETMLTKYRKGKNK